MAEEFALDEVGGDGAAIKHGKRASASVGELVDRLGHHLLARARLALDHHGGPGGRDLFDDAEELAHLDGAADEIATPIPLGWDHLEPLVEGEERQLALAGGHRAPRVEIRLSDSDAVDGRPVRAVEIGEDVAVLTLVDLAVEAGDRVVVEDDVVVGVGPDVDHGLVKHPLHRPVRPLVNQLALAEPQLLGAPTDVVNLGRRNEVRKLP